MRDRTRERQSGRTAEGHVPAAEGLGWPAAARV
jgi:hypothetical protein